MINVQASTTAELVAFYNKHAAKPVNKFADRKTAERRVTQLVEQLSPKAAPNSATVTSPGLRNPGDVFGSAMQAARLSPKAAAKVSPRKHTGSDSCPRCGATADITCGTVKELHGKQHLVDEHVAFCHSCGHSWDTRSGAAVRKSKARSQSTEVPRSDKIAASWKDKSVAAARATRHAVRVTDPKGGQGSYRSVREAFVVLALPLGRHIRFRSVLKSAGQATIDGHKFKLVDRA